MPEGPCAIPYGKLTNPSRAHMKHFMEALIHHFKFFSNGINLPEGLLYTAVKLLKVNLAPY